MESFRFPKNLSHRMTDEELFWRGSLVPEKKEFPFDRMPKIAFMFLTRGRLPFVPLWERFFRGQDARKYSIYVHTDPKFELGVANTSVFYKRQIPSQAVKWGSVSLVDAERRLLGNALLDFSNERFVLLSESCIPIHNFPTIYKYLVNSVYSYIDSYDDPSKYGRGRYSRNMKPDIRLRDWRKGSQWFEMNRELAIKIISDTKYYNLFHKYCTEDCYPDEHYMPTFVHMFHGSLNADRTVTYVDWSIGGPHPKSFGPKDITDSFMKSLRNNGTTCSFNKGTTPICYLFARKFNETALESLLKLDSEVLGY
ncbi:glycosyl transferase, family 14 protein [Tanacetum coccineum]